MESKKIGNGTKIEQIDIVIVTAQDANYNPAEQCQCCGQIVTPIQQNNGVDYYYTVCERVIDSRCLGKWLGGLGLHIAADPQPSWLHAIINR